MDKMSVPTWIRDTYNRTGSKFLARSRYYKIMVAFLTEDEQKKFQAIAEAMANEKTDKQEAFKLILVKLMNEVMLIEYLEGGAPAFRDLVKKAVNDNLLYARLAESGKISLKEAA